MTAEQTLNDAFDLAERILDELTRLEQNWRAVEHLATVLAELAGREARNVGRRRATRKRR